MNAVDEENEALRKRFGQRSGVVEKPYKQWEDFKDRRLDDGSHEEDETKPDG